MNPKVLLQAIEYIKPWLSFRYQQGDTPGFVVALTHKGKTVFGKAYGEASTEKHESMTPEHIFRIASHSKSFTATAILQLAEQGKLKIDDFVVQYLPFLQKHSDSRWQKVTIRQVLSHSAGVIRDGSLADYWQLEGAFPNNEELKKLVLEANLIIDANTQMKYSNIGYGILGLLIETVSGKSYSKFVSDSIIKPLKLANTGPDITNEIENKLVTGYSRKDTHKNRLPIENISTGALAPATGFYSNAEDLCTFYRALRVGSGKLLSDESKKEMQRTQWRVHNSLDGEEYGLGLTVEYYGEKRLWGHSGGFPGQLTMTLYDPEDDLMLVVLTNCLGSDLDAVGYGILSILDYYKEHDKLGRSSVKFKPFCGRYISLWGVTDIVHVGAKLLAAYPGWKPFSNPEELTFVDNETLKVTKTNGYNSASELIKFTFDKTTHVESVTFCG